MLHRLIEFATEPGTKLPWNGWFILSSHMFIPALLIIMIVLYAQSLFAAEIQEFSADYAIYYGDIHLGKANYRFSHSKENYYRFDFASDLRFLIFWDAP